jgi:hypothetical protein
MSIHIKPLNSKLICPKKTEHCFSGDVFHVLSEKRANHPTLTDIMTGSPYPQRLVRVVVRIRSWKGLPVLKSGSGHNPHFSGTFPMQKEHILLNRGLNSWYKCELRR